MPRFRLYDLTVHYKDKEFVIRDVDPDMYCQFDLISDICSVNVVDCPSNSGVNVRVSYQLGNNRFEISSDEELLQMFDLAQSPLIQLFVEAGDVAEGGPSQVTQVVDNEVDEMRVNIPAHIGRYGESENEIPVLAASQGEYKDVRGLDGRDDEYFTMFDEEQFNGLWSGDSDSEDRTFRENDIVGEHDSERDSNFKHLTREDSSSRDDDPHMDNYQSNDSSGVDESDAEARRKKAKVGAIFQQKKGEKIVFEKGMRFRDVSHFREVLREYVVQEGFILVRDKNEKKRVTAHCAGIKCQWRIHASPMPDGETYQIKSLISKHDCSSVSKNAEANSTWIAKKLKERLRENPSLKVEAIKSELSRRFGIDAGSMQVYRAKRKALDEIEGSHSESYVKLPAYAAEIRRSNPGSVVKIQLDRLPSQVTPSFKRFFMSLEGQVSGFLKGCRPFIGLDGCHLKGPFGGVLLAAVGLDADEGIFPIAYGIVESETKDSWMFFLEHLNTSLGAASATVQWTFMSDGQKGIEPAIRLHFPAATQRRCGRHLYKNFSKSHPGLQLRALFWAAARAYNFGEFNKVMGRMKNVSAAAHRWCMDLPLHLWARHRFSPIARSDHVTNNLTESFNQWIADLRAKPVLTLIDGLRSKLMARIHIKFEQAGRWNGPLTKVATKRLDKIIEGSRKCSVLYAGTDEYEVTEGQTRHVVYLAAKSCSCGVWDISGMPCKHATASILYRRLELNEYCDKAFSKQAYLDSYSGIIHPLLDESMWTAEVIGDPIQPPQLRRLTGRPKKNRRRDDDEIERATSSQRKWHSIVCKTCGSIGHNKRTCQRAPVKQKKTGGRKFTPVATVAEESTAVGAQDDSIAAIVEKPDGIGENPQFDFVAQDGPTAVQDRGASAAARDRQAGAAVTDREAAAGVTDREAAAAADVGGENIAT